MTEAEMMTRPIRLTKGWYKNYCGDILTKTKDGKEIRMTSSVLGGYRYFDSNRKRYRHVTFRNYKSFAEDALLCYQPLPDKTGFWNFLLYMIRTLNIREVAYILFAAMSVTLIGALYPTLSDLLYNQIIPSYRGGLLYILLFMYLGIAVTGTLFSVTENFILAGIETKMGTLVEAAFLGRCMVLPMSFYKKYSSGQISEWMECIPQLCTGICNLVFGTGITSVLSFFYIIQIHRYVPEMVIPTLLIISVFFLVCSFSAVYQTKWTRKQIQGNSKLTGMLYDFLCGIEKIKLENAKDRVMKIWFKQYDEVSTYTYAPPLFVRISPILPVVMSSAAGLAVLFCAKAVGMEIGEYMVFYSSFGMILGAIMKAAQTMDTLATLKPQYEILETILEEKTECCETDDNEEIGDEIQIDMQNISFGYEPERLILKDFSVHIPYGDYVAIVGSTGCGKTTFLRLLLGFEKAQKGSIYYNGHDFWKLNPANVRKHIGVVLQNDKLLPGSILENMRMSNPDVTEQEIWNALETAGIADDVRGIPMRLETIVGERNVFSGGQIQRLLIARAILGQPDILIMDEATSALDNDTQARVAEALDQITCTRIVVAHRFSTIRNCRRILVFKEGHIVEDGSYEELMSHKGEFFKLVNRQMS